MNMSFARFALGHLILSSRLEGLEKTPCLFPLSELWQSQSAPTGQTMPPRQGHSMLRGDATAKAAARQDGLLCGSVGHLMYLYIYICDQTIPKL